MKMDGSHLSLFLSALALIGLISCGQGAPTGKAGAPSKPATESAGQAIVDSIKTPLDKARNVENKLGKAAERTDDAIKDATQ